MRIVITLPDVPADPARAAEVLRGIIPDLNLVADGIAAEVEGELRPGQYGFTTDPGTQALRMHWAYTNEPEAEKL